MDGRRDCRWTNGECFADGGDSGECAIVGNVVDFFREGDVGIRIRNE